MTTRVPIGHLVAVLGPPDPEQRVMEDLVRTGTMDLENAESARGLGDWQPLPVGPAPSAGVSEVLLAMRDQEDR
ncbi:hypothetical protein ACFVWX_16220 [Streptomyces sp. NPDC058220]|uniref:hypothetical protein n=1 Tax=unclassified Streptomyces TaxID=2593676 RepID=UPI003654B6C8